MTTVQVRVLPPIDLQPGVEQLVAHLTVNQALRHWGFESLHRDMWKAQIVWRKTVPCFYRGQREGLPAPLLIVEKDVRIAMTVPVPVYLHAGVGNSYTIILSLVGDVMHLNEDDGGTIFTHIQLYQDPAALPQELYPIPYLGAEENGSKPLVSVTLSGNQKAWPGIESVT